MFYFMSIEQAQEVNYNFTSRVRNCNFGADLPKIIIYFLARSEARIK